MIILEPGVFRQALFLQEGYMSTLEERKQLISDLIGGSSYIPMKFKEMASLLCVPKEDRETFKELIDLLISEGKASYDSNGRIRKGNSNQTIGIFTGNSKGYGFVKIEGEDEDIFISPDDTNTAHDKDKVMVNIRSGHTHGRNREGIIVRVIERATSQIIGTFDKNRGFSFVIPDNPRYGSDIYIPKDKTLNAVSGHKVLVQITDFGTSDRNPEGQVLSILGHINDPGSDLMSIATAYSFPIDFTEETKSQCDDIPDEICPDDITDRLDLRDQILVTIDGEDAKDLDDAVSLTVSDNIYQLGVHIADVSHYVTEGSPLDQEALTRGTSIYLIDSVIPMLPIKLSNGICSLNAGQDRLALSCLMDIDRNGNIISHDIRETVIRVSKRMNYTDVNKVLINDSNDPDNAENTNNIPNDYVPYKNMLLEMGKLSTLLRQKRYKRGSIDFEIPESKIKVDRNGKVLSVEPYTRNRATDLIEDFMLAANETIAEDFFWQDIPFVFRSHEAPDPDKIKKLNILVNNFGYSIHISNDEMHPKEFQKLLSSVMGKEEEALISRLTLRSMRQARYTPDCLGHFGLAAKYYCHFTSPIRRYPDLQIHRIIKESIHGSLDEQRTEHYNAILGDVCVSTSASERRADEAEREIEKLKKVEYMRKYIGEEFSGVISGVTATSLFVELPNTVEGIIKVSDLHDDRYRFNEERYQLTGTTFSKVYKLGQKITVLLADADKLTRTIEFRPVRKDE